MSDTLNRRGFLVASPLLASAVLADEKDNKPPADPPAPSPVDAVLAQVLLTYPDPRLDEAALSEIRGDIRQHQARSAILSKFPLANGDEPSFIFRAYRGES